MQSKGKISTTGLQFSDNCKLFSMHLHYKAIWIYAYAVENPTLFRAFLNVFTHERERTRDRAGTESQR